MINNLVLQIFAGDIAWSCISLLNGESVRGSEYESDLRDCIKTGDCQQACDENRLATDSEMKATCEAIYFESDSDFTDMRLAQIYLVWDAASELDSDDI
jgi:hypothetical protein